MSDTTFHPGGLAPAGTGIQRSTLEQLSPGEKVVPIRVLESHWAGDSSALADWARENGMPWPQEEE